ncbi:MAG: hypothetical protein MUE49_12650 [Rhodospirillales bacterium]|jgi:hypothetical protein|nr:hypothetical protein [Rhodospirillales bacterium]
MINDGSPPSRAVDPAKWAFAIGGATFTAHGRRIGAIFGECDGYGAARALRRAVRHRSFVAREASVLEADALARAAAGAIAADTDPSLPSRVEKALSGATRDCVAAFLVDAARHACRLAAARVNTPPSAWAVEQRLRREFGLDDGMAAELDAIVAAIAEQVWLATTAPPPAA